MEILREFRRSASNRIVLEIPEKFVEKELEILIIPTNHDQENKRSASEREELFENLCGIWKDRDDISLESIRNKAWKRH